MENLEGYVNLWRKSIDSSVFKNPEIWKFWCWCLMKATWQPYKAKVGLQSIELLPGQFIFGLEKASKEINISIRKIRGANKLLEKEGNLTIKTTNKFSIITICNWEIYQNIEKIKGKQNGKQRANKTSKKGNIQELINNNNKDKILYGEFVLLTEIEYQKLCDKFEKYIADDWIERMNLYAASKPKEFNKYSSHYATILNWDRMKREREGKEPTPPRKVIYLSDLPKDT